MEAPVGDAFCPGSRTRADPPRVAASFRFHPTLMVEARRSIPVDSVLIIVLSGLISVQVKKFNTYYNTNFNAQQKVSSAHIARDWRVGGATLGGSGRSGETTKGACDWLAHRVPSRTRPLQNASPPKRQSLPQHSIKPTPVKLRKKDTAHHLHLAFYNVKMECDSNIPRQRTYNWQVRPAN
ncbi:hypothetical protein CSV71_16225 [Sporosarcina sp. P21c]|nr:hypothetical protein CSV71_16225 [Sporosarcina sp. P21c]